MSESMQSSSIYPELKSYISQIETESEEVSSSRKNLLRELADYINYSNSEHRLIKLLFVCTHNSRRSHLAQVWAHTYAAYFGIPDLLSYSGGTESTAFHPNAIAALQRCGFHVDVLPTRQNPRQKVMFGPNGEELFCYSKKFDDPPNPEHNFAAIMVCSDADQNCPIIPGAEKRISLPYTDPKTFDETSKAAEGYDESCRLIGRELFWAFRLAASQIR